MLFIHYFKIDNLQINILSFSTTILTITGVLLLIPFHLIPNFILDNKEWKQNKTVEELVEKLRLRALLFNNISLIIFLVTIIVIIVGFYLLIYQTTLSNNDTTVSITIRISASILLIFLVQILFRVFKYLLRVAAFYNGKADGLELNEMKLGLPLDKLIDMFTPDKYDITDLQESSIADKLVDLVKGK